MKHMAAVAAPSLLAQSLVVLGLLALSACSKQIEAPADRGVCWHMVQLKDGKTRFNKVAENTASVEQCAAALEGMRLRFLGLGGQTEEITGAYQGQFLFLGREGVFFSQSLKGNRYLLLVPTGDGRLAKPGAMPQQ